MSRTALIALSAALVFVPTIRGDDSIEDQKKFDGTWEMIVQEENGTSVPAAALKGMSVVFDAGRYEVKQGDMVVESGTFKLDAGKSPRTVDFKILKSPTDAGKSQVGIYQFDRENLKLCVAVPAGSTSRPTTMAARQGSQALMMVLKKKAP